MLASLRSKTRSLYTLPKAIDTNRVRHTFLKPNTLLNETMDSSDPKLFANRVVNKSARKKKASLLPSAMPSSPRELDALLVRVQQERLAPVSEFTKEEFDKMEKQIQVYLDWMVVTPDDPSQIRGEEDLSELAKLERKFITMTERRGDGRRWDDLADINRQELRELKRLQLKLQKLKRAVGEANLDCNWTGLDDSPLATDLVAMGGYKEDVESILSDLEHDVEFNDIKTATDLSVVNSVGNVYANQFPYQSPALTTTTDDVWSFDKEQRLNAQSIANREQRLTTKYKLVPKQLGKSEEGWSLPNQHDVAQLQRRVDSFVNEFSTFQRELQFKRRQPVCDFFWLENVSAAGFARLCQVYDDYVYGAEPGQDLQQEKILLDLLHSVERLDLIKFTGRVRLSDLITPLEIGETSDLACMGKYVTVGHWLYDREVPRSFEKYEWSPRMLRLRSLELQDYPKQEQPEMADQIEQFLEIRRKTFFMNRWELKYDIKPLVKPHNRQLMMREPGIKLCHELEVAAATNSSVCKLLLGPRGVGKSATLLHTVAWARENGWITVVLPRAAQLVTSRGALESGAEEYGINVMPPDSKINPTWFGQPKGAEEILQRIKLAHLHELSTLEQQREYTHKLYDAPRGKKTLAHILMRGLQNLSTAPDALYDLKMELNLQTKYPVLIAVDEFDALYWPTAVWYNNQPVPAHRLTVCKTFRFIDSVPGDVEDDNNPRTVRHAKLNPEHLPKRGGIIAACTRSLEAEPHESQIPPCRFEAFPVDGVDYVHVPKYTADEVEKSVMWYKERNLYAEDEVDEVMMGRIRALTGGFADKVAIFSQNRNIQYPRDL
ncbi:hypothetical protein BASA81_008833 [Batrachochytrium salamandrivorans]|nr:hypothetical protein BASA81_008833 [Batrachochytrium salamandrivorans]